MENVQYEKRALFYPPGGILIWIIIVIELITFVPALIVFFYHISENTQQFSESARHLDLTSGTINTVILITGGYFVAQAIQCLRADQISKTPVYLVGAILTGVAFIIIKSYEYKIKLDHGFDLHFNDFFLYYWLVTGFHYIHVIVGTVLLLIAFVGVKKGSYTTKNHADVETIGIFWHMCDLIWIIVFPAFYILSRSIEV